MRAGFQTETQNRAAKLASWGLRLGAKWFVLALRENKSAGRTVGGRHRGKLLLMALCPLPSAASDSLLFLSFILPPSFLNAVTKTQKRGFVSPNRTRSTSNDQSEASCGFSSLPVALILPCSAAVSNSKKHGQSQTLIFIGKKNTKVFCDLWYL